MDDKLSRIIRGGVFLILIAVPLIYSSQTQEAFSLPKRAFFQIVVSVLLCLFAVQAVLKPERLVSRGTPLDIILLVWLFWNATACIFSLDRPESTRDLIYISCLAGFFFLITRNVATHGQAWLLIGAIIAMGVLEASYGIAERLGAKLLYEKEIVEPAMNLTEQGWRGSILGTFGNANHLASYLVLSTPLILGCIILCGYNWWYIFMPCLGAVLGCLVLTGARAAWLASFAGLSFLVLFAFRQSRRIGLSLTAFAALMLVGVLVLILFTQPGLLTELSGRITESFSIYSGSLGYRFLAWRVALIMIGDRPLLGSGPGTFKLLFLPTLAEYLKSGDPLSCWSIKEKMNEPHNEYLQIAAETGIPGLLVFLLLVFTFVYTGWKNLTGASTSSGFLISALLASLTGVLAHALASIPFHVVPTFVTFWALISLLFSLMKADSPEIPRAPSGSRGWQWALAAGLFVFAGITIHSTSRELSFSRYFKTATYYNYMNNPKAALPYFRRALEIDPRSGRLKFYYGSTLVHLARYAEGAALLEESKKNFQDIYIYKNLAIAYEATGKPEKAAGQYEQWRQMGILSHEANNQIALIRLRQGRIAEAEELFKETLRVRPWDWTAHSNLGIIQMDSGRLKEAIETLKPDIFWRIPEAYSLCGVALLKAGRYEEAAKNFFIALSKDPDSIRAHNNLAALYYKTGEKEAAIREWEKVLELDPENKIARKNLKTARGKNRPDKEDKD